MSAPLTAEQVEAALNVAQRLIAQWVPDSAYPAARAAIEALRKPEAVEAIQLLGSVGLARANAWWSSVSPFSPPRVEPLSGVEAGMMEVRDASRSLVNRRDAEIAAFSALTNALIAVGWEGAKAALPFVIAAVRD